MSGLAEALCREFHMSRWEFPSRVIADPCEDCQEAADVAHRWYAERLGSEDVREAVARAISEARESMDSRFIQSRKQARAALTALRAALTERGDRG